MAGGAVAHMRVMHTSPVFSTLITWSNDKNTMVPSLQIRATIPPRCSVVPTARARLGDVIATQAGRVTTASSATMVTAATVVRTNTQHTQ